MNRYYEEELSFLIKDKRVVYHIEDVLKTYDELEVLKAMSMLKTFHGDFETKTHGLIHMAPRSLRLKYVHLIDDERELVQKMNMNDAYFVENMMNPKAQELVKEYLKWRNDRKEIEQQHECGLLLLFRMLKSKIQITPFIQLESYVSAYFEKNPSMLRIALCQAYKFAKYNKSGGIAPMRTVSSFVSVNRKHSDYSSPNKYYIITGAMIDSLRDFMRDFSKFYQTFNEPNGCKKRIKLVQLFPPSLEIGKMVKVKSKWLRKQWFTDYLIPKCNALNITMHASYYSRYKTAIQGCFLNYCHLGKESVWLMKRICNKKLKST
jgi:hypothetical protein